MSILATNTAAPTTVTEPATTPAAIISNSTAATATPATVNTPPPLNPLEQRQAQADSERQRRLEQLTVRLDYTRSQINQLRAARVKLVDRSNSKVFEVLHTGRGPRLNYHDNDTMRQADELRQLGLESWNGRGLTELGQLADALQDAIAELDSPANPSTMGR
jgi:hypothetical protein